ncbi:MAG: tetratricopeptide repeat protein [Acidobacteriota bacterium]|nr:tetratricopeptide repeat protein [Acidobacteriota bacterium]
MRAKFIFGIVLLLLATFGVFGQARKTAQTQTTSRTITVITEPKAVVWLDDVRYGATDDTGKLTLQAVPAGMRKLRVRADGFKEVSQNLLAAQKGDVKIVLTKTSDEAELTFQQAESQKDKTKAIELYQKAIRLRPKYAEANLGLARALSDESDTDEALKAIKAARAARPVYPEASAVEGRIYKSENNDEKAIASFKRAISEGKGFQPEAHAGLGLLYRDKAETAAAAGDFQSEKDYYILAVGQLIDAAAQLGGAPDAVTIYQLLGDSYERAKMYSEAVKVYEKFLRVFPDASEADAVRSFIVQLKKRMSGEQ